MDTLLLDGRWAGMRITSPGVVHAGLFAGSGRLIPLCGAFGEDFGWGVDEPVGCRRCLRRLERFGEGKASAGG